MNTEELLEVHNRVEEIPIEIIITNSVEERRAKVMGRQPCHLYDQVQHIKQQMEILTSTLFAIYTGSEDGAAAL